MKGKTIASLSILCLLAILAFKGSDQKKATTAGIYRNIFFDRTADTLMAEKSFNDLSEIYKILTISPENVYELRVHHGADFMKEYDNSITQKKADAIAAYLYAGMIDSTQLIPLGMEAHDPIISKPKEKGQFWVNNRVELVLVK